jgi:hypothetical protein
VYSTKETDGYDAVQVGYGTKKKERDQQSLQVGTMKGGNFRFYERISSKRRSDLK